MLRLLDRRVVFENSRFYVYSDDVEDALGNRVRDYLVVQPRKQGPNHVTGVGVLPVLGERVCLKRVSRHPAGEARWEIPRGFIEESESPLRSAQRELEEELGIALPDRSFRPLGSLCPEPGVLDARILLYAAGGRHDSPGLPEKELGHGGYGLFTWREIEQMASGSEIEDPCTLVAILRYRFLGGRE